MSEWVFPILVGVLVIAALLALEAWEARQDRLDHQAWDDYVRGIR